MQRVARFTFRHLYPRRGVARSNGGLATALVVCALFLAGCSAGNNEPTTVAITQPDPTPYENVSPRPEQDPNVQTPPPDEEVAEPPTEATVPTPVPSPNPASPGPLVPVPTLPPAAAQIVPRDPLPIADAARVGAWGKLANWPVIPIHVSVLPDGRVMTYGTDPFGKQGAKFHYDVWDPAAGIGADSHLTLSNTTGTDIFCSAQLVLPLTGELLMNGGDLWNTAGTGTTNTPVKDVTIFDPASNTMSSAGQMNRPRWYASATTLPTGEMYLQGGSGGNDRAEVRSEDGSFRLLTGFVTNDLGASYPRNFVGPDGKIFGMSYTKMYRIDPYANDGEGSRKDLGTITGYAPDWTSAAVMFEPGRILQVGGRDNKAAIIDINGSTPIVTSAGTLTQVRSWVNATVLADGKVAITGGSAVNNTTTQVAYQVELFDPVTKSWMVGPEATRMRLYHSTSVLLPDATLFTGGGGAPSPQTNLNAEIYYPPYLFKPDGTLATRPTITAAPTVVETASDFILVSPDAASIQRITMVATGSTTHSFDMNQRFVEPTFYRNGDQLVVNMPTNAYETPPGYYMVFAINSAGTPSVSRMVRVNVKQD